MQERLIDSSVSLNAYLLAEVRQDVAENAVSFMICQFPAIEHATAEGCSYVLSAERRSLAPGAHQESRVYSVHVENLLPTSTGAHVSWQ